MGVKHPPAHQKVGASGGKCVSLAKMVMSDVKDNLVLISLCLSFHVCKILSCLIEELQELKSKMFEKCCIYPQTYQNALKTFMWLGTQEPLLTQHDNFYFAKIIQFSIRKKSKHNIVFGSIQN